MFDGFRSRCWSPRSCARWSASHTSTSTRARCEYSSEGPSRPSSNPSTSSMMMTGGSASGRHSNTWTMRRSENSASVRASRRNASTRSLHRPAPRRMTLPATVRLRRRSRSLKTSPIPPAPSRSTVWKPSNCGRRPASGGAAAPASPLPSSVAVKARYRSTSVRKGATRSSRSAHNWSTGSRSPCSTWCSTNRASRDSSSVVVVIGASRTSAASAPSWPVPAASGTHPRCDPCDGRSP